MLFLWKIIILDIFYRFGDHEPEKTSSHETSQISAQYKLVQAYELTNQYILQILVYALSSQASKKFKLKRIYMMHHADDQGGIPSYIICHDIYK